MKKLIVIIFALVLSTTSCVVSKKQIGGFDATKCKKVETIKEKDFYLFWNQVSVNKIENKIPYKSYEITKKRNAFDGIVFYGTLGVFSFYTMEVKACKDN